MSRRITTGEVGGAVGGINITNTTVTAAENLDITFDPSGTGIFKVVGDAQIDAQGDLRFADADSSNYVAFQAPSTVASNVTWTLPGADGTANQAIVTNGSGGLSFLTVRSTITDTSVDATVSYPTFITATSGAQTSTGVSSGKLTFTPSTGLLTATTATFAGTVRKLQTENAITTSYTLALTDQDRVVACNNPGAITVTIPTNSAVAFPIGAVVSIFRLPGSSTVTLAASGGVTVNKTGTFASGEEIMVRKRGTDTWVVIDAPRQLVASSNTPAVVGQSNVHTYTSNANFVV
jgi:hypothetical protein